MQIFFRFDGKIKVPPSQNLNSENFQSPMKWGLFFMIFSVHNDFTNIFLTWRQDESAASRKFELKNF